jgi:hypothetical protein
MDNNMKKKYDVKDLKVRDDISDYTANNLEINEDYKKIIKIYNEENIKKEEQIKMLSNLIDKIKNNEIDLIDVKNKHNKDLSWNINIKIRIKKEIEELKKHTITL